MSNVFSEAPEKMNAYGWAARDSSAVLSPFHFSKRHEIVGEVIKIGSNVSKFKVGDIAVIMPSNLPLDGAAPLLCGGIRVYIPMKFYGLDRAGLHLGVVGLGGLGHVAVMFAKAFDMKVTVISASPGKEAEALERPGADAFLLSNDQQQLQDAMGRMDGITDTVSADHSLHPLVGLLKTSGKLILLGAPNSPPELPTIPIFMGRKMAGGNAGGGMKETQEMIDFAGKHNITAQVGTIPMDYVNTALERLAKNDVKYRFVIDVANTLNIIV